MSTSQKPKGPIVIAEALFPDEEGESSDESETNNEVENEEPASASASVPAEATPRPSMTMSFYNAATSAAGAVAGSLSPILFRSPAASPRGQQRSPFILLVLFNSFTWTALAFKKKCNKNKHTAS